MPRKHVSVSDSDGNKVKYILIETSEENSVTYAVLALPGKEESYDSYVVYGYDDHDSEYFLLPTEVAKRLLQHMRDRWDIDRIFFEAGDNLAVA